jgi:hypothetical protein
MSRCQFTHPGTNACQVYVERLDIQQVEVEGWNGIRIRHHALGWTAFHPRGAYTTKNVARKLGQGEARAIL